TSWARPASTPLRMGAAPDAQLVECNQLARSCYNRPMVARSMSTATISFGLVTVPIRLYAASETQSAVSFNLLHDKCHFRLKQQYICPKDEEIVGRDQMVKGYEFSKDQYVVFTEDEIKSMAEEAS